MAEHYELVVTYILEFNRGGLRAGEEASRSSGGGTSGIRLAGPYSTITNGDHFPSIARASHPAPFLISRILRDSVRPRDPGVARLPNSSAIDHGELLVAVDGDPKIGGFARSGTRTRSGPELYGLCFQRVKIIFQHVRSGQLCAKL